MDLEKIRKIILRGKYEWRKHILTRLAERNISQNTVIEVILKGEIIEEYPNSYPFPSCLILGWFENKPYHVVVSLDEKMEIVYFITVYQPSLNDFEPDYKTRRNK
jgi:hypothetical protein